MDICSNGRISLYFTLPIEKAKDGPLTHFRVSRARELLRRGVIVADAAQAVGFYDESQLHRLWW